MSKTYSRFTLTLGIDDLCARDLKVSRHFDLIGRFYEITFRDIFFGCELNVVVNHDTSRPKRTKTYFTRLFAIEGLSKQTCLVRNRSFEKNGFESLRFSSLKITIAKTCLLQKTVLYTNQLIHF